MNRNPFCRSCRLSAICINLNGVALARAGCHHAHTDLLCDRFYRCWPLGLSIWDRMNCKERDTLPVRAFKYKEGVQDAQRCYHGSP